MIFTTPLWVFLMGEVLMVLSALSPVYAVRAPAVSTCRLFKEGPGKYIMRTVSFLLFVICGNCVLELQKVSARMHVNLTSKDGNREMVSQDMEMLLVAQQGALITGVALLLIGVLRRLTDLTQQNATLNTSSAILQKQAKQMENEYMRLKDESDALTKSGKTGGDEKKKGGDDEADSDVAKLLSQLSRLEQTEKEVAELNDSLKEDMKLEKLKARREVDAMKTQAKGLEAEYDRLLEENDQMRRKLQRLEGAVSGGGGGGDVGSKKDS